MPKAHHASYNLAFKLKLVAEAEAIEDNSEIAIDEATNPIYFCHVLQVCLAMSGNESFLLVCFL